MKTIFRNGLAYIHQKNGRIEVIPFSAWLEKYSLEIKGEQFLQKVKKWI
jgi:hypothetical protein